MRPTPEPTAPVRPSDRRIWLHNGVVWYLVIVLAGAALAVMDVARTGRLTVVSVGVIVTGAVVLVAAYRKRRRELAADPSAR